MNTEGSTKFILYKLLKDIPNRGYYCVEIGVGNFDFYFLMFYKMGFKTIAVEPLPSEKLIKECKARKIELKTLCIAEKEQEIKIYHGNFNNSKMSDVSSIHSDWWGSGQEYSVVPAIKYDSLIRNLKSKKLLCVKIDVEGSEWEIIQQMNINNCPEIVMFEFGGGGKYREKVGGWNENFKRKTLNCIEHFKRLHFKSLIQVESTTGISIFDIDNLDAECLETDLFQDDMIFGNFIATKKKIRKDQAHVYENEYQDVEKMHFYKDGLFDKFTHRINKLL